jgi:hypothetical protein
LTPASKRLAIGAVSSLLGLIAVVFSMASWYLNQSGFSHTSGSGGPLVLYFYLGELLSMGLILIGVYQVYRSALPGILRHGGPSILSIIAQALGSRNLIKIGVVASVLYGLLYAFTSSTLVYQPSVDFGQAYGVFQPGWAFITCCGGAGSVPKLILYLAPAAHLAVQLAPLSLFLLFVVPPLVGVNAMVSYDALRNGKRQSGLRWSAASGAIVGLFTACPTCAGLFLAGSLGGIGLVAATALAPYQLLFILVSIPVLLVSPVLTAESLRRSMKAGCPLP